MVSKSAKGRQALFNQPPADPPTKSVVLKPLLENEGLGYSNTLSAIFSFSFGKNNAISRLEANVFQIRMPLEGESLRFDWAPESLEN